MPERSQVLVTNTTPLIALTAATGSLDVLRFLYTRVVVPQPFLRNSLDRGEAAAIQTALNLSLPLVCIDETAGRRIARLCALNVTGTVGVLLKAQGMGYALNIPDALQRMRDHGIWLSGQVVKFALSHGY